MELAVDCLGADDRLLLDGDDLVALNHDPVAEDVLVTLGSPPPPCAQITAAWPHWRTDPWILSQLLRGTRAAHLWSGRDRWDTVRYVSAGHGHPHVLRTLAQRRAGRAIGYALSLDPDSRRQLTASVVRQFERRWTTPSHDTPGLHAYLGMLVRKAAIQDITESVAPVPQNLLVIDFDLAEREPDVTLHATRKENAWAHRLHLRLQLSWLREVHCRGIGAVDGAFVTQVLAEQHGELLVEAACWSGSDLAPSGAVLRPRGDGWTLSWLDE